MDKIHISFSADENYAQHMGVSIASILCSSARGDTFKFHILDGGISEESKAKINNLQKIKPFEIEYLPINSGDFKDFPLMSMCIHVTLPGYYRFKLASLRPELDQIIYLDCDVIVKRSLSALWNEDISDFIAGAVEDATFPQMREYNTQRLGCKKYFNSGVLLLNLKKFRELDVEARCFDFVEKEKEKIYCNDQDVLNAVFKDKTKFLHPRWNVQTWALSGGNYEYFPEPENIDALNNPAIIHFTTRFKPWDPRLRHQLEEEYFKYLKYTDWKNFIYKYNFLLIKSFFSNSRKKRAAYRSYDEILDYLNSKNFQKRIDNLSKKYKNKKIIIYGAGNAFNAICKNFDLSGLNIIGVSDIKFSDDKGFYKNYKKISPQNITVHKPDIVLISMLESEIASEYFKKELIPKYGKFKYESFNNNSML